MTYVQRAWSLFWRDRSLWPFVWRPLAVSALLFVAIYAIGFILIWPALGLIALPVWVSGPAALLAFGALVFFLSGPLFLTLAITVNAMGWDRLSREIERRETGMVVDLSPSFSRIMVDGWVRIGAALALGVVGFCAAFVIPVVVPVLIAGYLGLHDYTAPAFYRRGLLFAGQRRLAFRLRQWPPFLVLAGVSALFPFINIFVLPLFVTAGTLMFLDSRDRLGLR